MTAAKHPSEIYVRRICGEASPSFLSGPNVSSWSLNPKRVKVLSPMAAIPVKVEGALEHWPERAGKQWGFPTLPWLPQLLSENRSLAH